MGGTTVVRRGMLALGAAGLLAAPAQAAPTWLQPVTVSPSATSAPQVATAPAGDAVAVWLRTVDGVPRAEAATRTAGAGFGTPQTLGGAGAADPDVAMADDGTAVAVWREGPVVRYAIRAPGAGFAEAQALADDGATGTPAALAVDVTRGGEALITYGRGRAFAALRAPGGAFGPPVAVSSDPACTVASDLGDGGHAAVAWLVCDGGGTVAAARRNPGGGFRAPEALPTATALDVAVDDDGATIAALETGGAIRATQAAPQGGFPAPQRVNAADSVGSRPAVVARGTTAWLGWRQATRIAVARRPRLEAFGAPQTVSEPGTTDGPPLLAAAPDGAAVVAWRRDTGNGTALEATHRTATGATHPDAIVGGASAADLTADADGNAIAGALAGGQAVARVLDVAPPRLLGIDARSAGFAADPYAFAFEPADAWSGVAGAGIDFGDGTRADGRRATHTYAREGTYALTFSAVDGVGNAGSTQRSFLAVPALDRTPPVLSNVRLDATRFRTTGRATAVAAAVRRGNRFRYTLSEPAAVTVFFEKVVMGRRRGTACRRGARRGRRCRLYEPIGLITRRHPAAGNVSVGFSGRIVGHQGPLKIVDIRLTRGRYRATLVAADANRNASGIVQLAFTVVR